MNRNILAFRSSIRNFCIKFHASLMLAYIKNLFSGRATTKHLTNASSEGFCAASTAGSRLRPCYESAYVCKINESISIRLETLLELCVRVCFRRLRVTP